MTTPAPTINGTSGAYEQPQKFGVDSSGPYCVRTWVGTAAAIAAQYNLCVAGGAVAEVEAGIAVHKVIARYSFGIGGGGLGGGEVPVDDWEFFASHVEKDVLEADKTVINSLDNGDKKQIKNLIANPPATPGAIPAWNTDNGADLYALMENGLRSVRVNAPTLRHTATVSNQYQVKASLTNVGRIISSSSLALSESIPSGVLFNLPNDVWGGGSSPAGQVLAYGWFKFHPSVKKAARQKMQIEQEWEWGLWTTLVYGLVL